MFNNHNSGINFKIAKITVVILIALLTIACGNRTPWESIILITDGRETITLQLENLPPNPDSCSFALGRKNLDSGLFKDVRHWERYGDDCDTSYCETISLERGFMYEVLISNRYTPSTGFLPQRWAKWYIDVPALQDDTGLIEEAIQRCENAPDDIFDYEGTCVVDPETSPCDIQAPD